MYQKLKDIGYTVPNIIDKISTISESAELANGIFGGKNTVINANAKIGKMCIVNTGAIVEHDSVIGEFSHVAVGSVICGGVFVRKQTLIGANATIIKNRIIGNYSIIDAGTTVRRAVEDYGMVCNYEIIKNAGGYKISLFIRCAA